MKTNKLPNIMKRTGIKKSNLLVMIMLFCGMSLMVQAQENNWARQRSQHLKKQLELTDEQANQIYEAFTTSDQKRKEIRANIAGDEQKKALWRIDKEQNDKIASILTPQQNEKLKALREQESNKNKANVQQKPASSGAVQNKWAQQRSQYYKNQLGLTDEQTNKVYEELAAAAERAKEIKATKEGDEQKKALWRNDKERNDRLFKILTPEQTEKLKALWKSGKK